MNAHATRDRIVRGLLLLLFALFFVVPIGALVEFSTRAGGSVTGGRTLAPWREIGQFPELVSAIIASLELALLTSVLALLLLLPTMIWVRLRLPRLARTVEFLCLLPLTIPAIVLVVGWAPIYLWITYFTPAQYQASPLALTFAYIILVLPYLYRALDSGLSAIDVQTLAEAARSLGASWQTVMVRVVVPNMSSAVLNAALLSSAQVIGEFTVASLLNYENVAVAIVNVQQSNVATSVAVAAGALLVTFLLLLTVSFVGARGRAATAGKED